MNALLCAEVGSDGVIAASGGNHGVAVAWAARSLRYPANIFVPSLISSRKLEKLKSYGAQVHVTGREYHDALSAARQFTLGRNCVELHAYDQTEVISGAGTIAMEIDAQVPDATTVIVACGGGGLAGGKANDGARRRYLLDPQFKYLDVGGTAGRLIAVAAGNRQNSTIQSHYN